MKPVSLYFILLAPLFLSWQSVDVKTTHISKLVIDSKKTYSLTEGDSLANFVIDTLIMKDRSQLFFRNKKGASLTVNHAIIGKNCVFAGNDSKNNGTNLELSINFKEFGSLFINVSGEDSKISNRNFDNGNGGKVNLKYLSTGKKPQLSNKKLPHYLSIENNAGGLTVNPQNDIDIVFQQMRNGSRGRPLGNLPNGRVYSGNMGNRGTTSIKAVSSFN
jgi:hypothetical protein